MPGVACELRTGWPGVSAVSAGRDGGGSMLGVAGELQTAGVAGVVGGSAHVILPGVACEL